MQKVKNIAHPLNAGRPFNLFNRKNLLSFLEPSLVLVHAQNSAVSQKGDIHEWVGEIEYTPLRSTYLSVSKVNPLYPQSLWVEPSGEKRLEHYKMWFDSSHFTSQVVDNLNVREYQVHFESSPSKFIS